MLLALFFLLLNPQESNAASPYDALSSDLDQLEAIQTTYVNRVNAIIQKKKNTKTTRGFDGYINPCLSANEFFIALSNFQGKVEMLRSKNPSKLTSCYDKLQIPRKNILLDCKDDPNTSFIPGGIGEPLTFGLNAGNGTAKDQHNAYLDAMNYYLEGSTQMGAWIKPCQQDVNNDRPRRISRANSDPTRHNAWQRQQIKLHELAKKDAAQCKAYFNLDFKMPKKLKCPTPPTLEQMLGPETPICTFALYDDEKVASKDCQILCCIGKFKGSNAGAADKEIAYREQTSNNYRAQIEKDSEVGDEYSAPLPRSRPGLKKKK